MIVVYLIAAIALLVFPVILIVAGLYAVGSTLDLYTRKSNGAEEDHPGNP